MDFYYTAQLIVPGRCWECGAPSIWHGETVWTHGIPSKLQPIFKEILGDEGIHEFSYMSTELSVSRLEEAIAKLGEQPGPEYAHASVYLQHMLIEAREHTDDKAMWRIL